MAQLLLMIRKGAVNKLCYAIGGGQGGVENVTEGGLTKVLRKTKVLSGNIINYYVFSSVQFMSHLLSIQLHICTY